MRSTTRSKVPILDQWSQESDMSALASRILQHIEEQIPLDAALLVSGNPPHVTNPHGLSISEGSMMFVLPLVHEGIVEAVLYLRNRNDSDNELKLQQRKALDSICEIAAQAVARLRVDETTGTPASLPTELTAKPMGKEGLPNPVSVMSSRVLGIIAHDLRTPVTVVRGYLKLMLSERTGAVTQNQRECLDGALNSMLLLSAFAEQMDKASELMEQIHPELLNVQSELWQKNWEEVQTQAEEKAVSLRINVPAEQLTVWGDRRMLCEVIQKVLACAVGLANRNSELFVEVFSRRSGDIVLRIAFTGSLEPSDDNVVSGLQPKVFVNGGKLTFSPSSESGSSFTLSLPGKDA